MQNYGCELCVSAGSGAATGDPSEGAVGAPSMKNMQNRLDCEKRIQKVGKDFVFEGPLEEKWSGSPVGAGLARVHSAAARNPSFIKHNSDL